MKKILKIRVLSKKAPVPENQGVCCYFLYTIVPFMMVMEQSRRA